MLWEVLVTNKLIEDEDKNKDITLGALTGFFGFYNEKNEVYIKRNQDLLADGIEEQTYEFIIDTLKGVVGLRNGYFHKHNLNNWDKIREARNSARLVFWLIFGAYDIDEKEKEYLGIIKGNEHDDFYKLCKYLNKKAYIGSGLVFPVFYLDGQTDSSDFWMGYQDDFIEYDEYGESIYSGIYFKRIGEDRIIKQSTKEGPIKEIWEGQLTVSKSVPIEFILTGPEKNIYKDGMFLAE